MLIQLPYDRAGAVKYAEAWALKRNPSFPNFDGMGGDCTNFASQCVYAGCKVMNFTKTYGWYCKSYSERSPSWSGVEFFYNFFTGNKSAGPYAEQVDLSGIEAGDLVQLGTQDGHFYHTPVVISVEGGEVFVAAHTFDTLRRPLSSYSYSLLRCIHVIGARKWQ
jgi:hypothetical protein